MLRFAGSIVPVVAAPCVDRHEVAIVVAAAALDMVVDRWVGDGHENRIISLVAFLSMRFLLCSSSRSSNSIHPSGLQYSAIAAFVDYDMEIDS